MFKYILLTVLILSGCSTVAKIQDKGAESISKLIIAYCVSTDELTRKLLRDDVNSRLDSFAEIEITCAL